MKVGTKVVYVKDDYIDWFYKANKRVILEGLSLLSDKEKRVFCSAIAVGFDVKTISKSTGIENENTINLLLSIAFRKLKYHIREFKDYSYVKEDDHEYCFEQLGLSEKWELLVDLLVNKEMNVYSICTIYKLLPKNISAILREGRDINLELYLKAIMIAKEQVRGEKQEMPSLKFEPSYSEEKEEMPKKELSYFEAAILYNYNITDDMNRKAEIIISLMLDYGMKMFEITEFLSINSSQLSSVLSKLENKGVRYKQFVECAKLQRNEYYRKRQQEYIKNRR